MIYMAPRFYMSWRLSFQQAYTPGGSGTVRWQSRIINTIYPSQFPILLRSRSITIEVGHVESIPCLELLPKHTVQALKATRYPLERNNNLYLQFQLTSQHHPDPVVMAVLQHDR
jgi:hypothetical protein